LWFINFQRKIRYFLALVKHYAVKICGDFAIHEHPFLSSVVDHREWSDSVSTVLPQQESAAVTVEKEAELVPASVPVLIRGLCRE
jgi:hypothetical protein